MFKNASLCKCLEMPIVGNDTASVRKLLHKWDHGNKQVRARILEEFIITNQNKTGPEIETDFAQSASLFLTRLTAWLRMTYLFCSCFRNSLCGHSILMLIFH